MEEIRTSKSLKLKMLHKKEWKRESEGGMAKLLLLAYYSESSYNRCLDYLQPKAK